MKIIFPYAILMLFAGCMDPNYQSSGSDNSVSRSLFDSTNRALDSVSQENESLKNSLNSLMAAYEELIEKNDSEKLVRVGFIWESTEYKIHSLEDINQLVEPKDPEISTYTARTEIVGIIPDREHSSYQINSNTLQLIDPSKFWEHYRFCLIVVKDIPQENYSSENQN